MRQWTAVCRYIEIDRRWQRGETQKSIAYSKKITQGRVWQILRRVEKIKDCMVGLYDMKSDAFDVVVETEACRDQCFGFERCLTGSMLVNYGRDHIGWL